MNCLRGYANVSSSSRVLTIVSDRPGRPSPSLTENRGQTGAEPWLRAVVVERPEDAGHSLWIRTAPDKRREISVTDDSGLARPEARAGLELLKKRFDTRTTEPLRPHRPVRLPLEGHRHLPVPSAAGAKHTFSGEFKHRGSGSIP